MWAIRLLSGPQAGQVTELKMGRNLVGRAPHCDVKVLSNGVSKEHSEITVTKEKILVTDLKSSNGTFVNGIKIQMSLLRLGDKLSVHDIIMDIVPAQQQRALTPQAPQYGSSIPVVPSYGAPAQHIPAYGIPQPHSSIQSAQPMQAGSPTPLPGAPAAAYNPEGPVRQLLSRVQEYMDQVALPGVYKLPQLIEFRYVLLGFIIVFILSTTLLSMIPMMAITRAGIVTESKRRAQSIARTLATINQGPLMQGSYASLNTNAAESEEGVKQVLIVQQSDGMTLAPASRAGTTPDLPFVHTARREMRPQSVEIDSSTIGASFPIGLYDASSGEQTVKAHAIVLYDIGSLAFDDGHALSLFMQTLVLASIIGLLIFYFMYKLVEYPLTSLNSQLDTAMREKRDSTEVNFLFPPLQALVGNINSLLTRYMSGDNGSSPSGGFINKEGEAENLVQVIGYPCVAINRDGKIISANTAFAQILRVDLVTLNGHSYQAIPDAAVQQNIEHLINRSRENIRMVHNDQLEFGGHPCVLSCQAMSSNGQDADYYLITVSPAEGGG